MHFVAITSNTEKGMAQYDFHMRPGNFAASPFERCDCSRRSMANPQVDWLNCTLLRFIEAPDRPLAAYNLP
jgi:hypothetical protein